MQQPPRPYLDRPYRHRHRGSASSPRGYAGGDDDEGTPLGMTTGVSPMAMMAGAVRAPNFNKAPPAPSLKNDGGGVGIGGAFLPAGRLAGICPISRPPCSPFPPLYPPAWAGVYRSWGPPPAGVGPHRHRDAVTAPPRLGRAGEGRGGGGAGLQASAWLFGRAVAIGAVGPAVLMGEESWALQVG